MTTIHISGSNNETSLIIESEKSQIIQKKELDNIIPQEPQEPEEPKEPEEINIGLLSPIKGGLQFLGKQFIKYAIYPLLKFQNLQMKKKMIF